VSTKILQKNTSFHVKKIQFCKKTQKNAKNCALLRASQNQRKTMQKPALFVHFSVIHAIFQEIHDKIMQNEKLTANISH